VNAIAGRKRDEIFVASKVLSKHLKLESLVKSCKKSLQRLGTSYMDLYQIHFPNSRVPIADTYESYEDLLDQGLIRSIRISNFSYKQTVDAVHAMKRHEAAQRLLSRVADKGADFGRKHFACPTVRVLRTSPASKIVILPVSGTGTT
jgi:diketogulonate reductase-like aldo/keto reductase